MVPITIKTNSPLKIDINTISQPVVNAAKKRRLIEHEISEKVKNQFDLIQPEASTSNATLISAQKSDHEESVEEITNEQIFIVLQNI